MPAEGMPQRGISAEKWCSFLWKCWLVSQTARITEAALETPIFGNFEVTLFSPFSLLALNTSEAVKAFPDFQHDFRRVT